ncbi:phage tail protein [Azospirillum sp. TSH100]|uniref:phage tail protein n=1 Tax=Azospirillum sp. TSH100 TaxID=652764 RepID=UPI0010A9A7E7|nr:phage tail protein [Azospirillum sp. TSH100]QCG92093.1 tail fiber protein [Azospirillum sp. TSH100]
MTNVPDNLPKNSVIMWYGSADEVPDGWAICDGKNLTPDMRERFPIGVGANYIPQKTGGSSTIVIKPQNLPPHTHSYSQFTQKRDNWKSGGDASPGDGTGGNIEGQTDNGPGTGQPIETLPPYFAIYFIMKIK